MRNEHINIKRFSNKYLFSEKYLWLRFEFSFVWRNGKYSSWYVTQFKTSLFTEWYSQKWQKTCLVYYRDPNILLLTRKICKISSKHLAVYILSSGYVHGLLFPKLFVRKLTIEKYKEILHLVLSRPQLRIFFLAIVSSSISFFISKQLEVRLNFSLSKYNCGSSFRSHNSLKNARLLCSSSSKFKGLQKCCTWRHMT